MREKNGYSICFNEWALDKDIKNELGLLLIISSLCAETGYCYATNEYLANLFGIDKVSISRKLKKLEDKGYLTIDYKKRGCEIEERYLRLTKMLTDDLQKCYPSINKNVKENNIKLNNTNNNIKKENNIKEKKSRYGEYQNVLLTDSELEKLKQTYFDYEDLITFLDEYIEMKGYKAKSHYLCIKKWVVDAVAKNNKKKIDVNKWLEEEDE